MSGPDRLALERAAGEAWERKARELEDATRWEWLLRHVDRPMEVAGDGVTDDTEAIQWNIDHRKGIG